jgi:hypothetical protein
VPGEDATLVAAYAAALVRGIQASALRFCAESSCLTLLALAIYRAKAALTPIDFLLPPPSNTGWPTISRATYPAKTRCPAPLQRRAIQALTCSPRPAARASTSTPCELLSSPPLHPGLPDFSSSSSTAAIFCPTTLPPSLQPSKPVLEASCKRHYRTIFALYNIVTLAHVRILRHLGCPSMRLSSYQHHAARRAALGRPRRQ